jgi:rubrerythrin
MLIDDTQLHQLIEESQDQHSDAMKQSSALVPDLRDFAAQRGSDAIITPAQMRALDESRSRIRSRVPLAVGAGGIALAVHSLLSRPAAADAALDIQALQTASSLEVLAVATYGVALTLPFIADGNATVKAFAEMTMKQHDEHRAAFQAQTKALGGEIQENPNPKYAPVVEATKPKLLAPIDVVNFAAVLEQVATETYLANLALLEDSTAKALFASVMAVECQHLAVLRAVGALLDGGGEALIMIPTDVAALPAAAGSVAFPDDFQATDMASPPEEGAL